MKYRFRFKIIICVGLILPYSLMHAQSTTKNFVAVSEIQKSGVIDASTISSLPYSSNNGKMKTITYYDGLGRPDQEVQCNASPLNSNLISLHFYDYLGRESKQYLPYAYGSNGNYDESPYDNQADDYTDSKPYGYTDYYESPLNLVIRQYGPGAAWHASGTNLGHPVSFSYVTNKNNEVLNIIIDGNDVAVDGYYSAGSLTGTKVTNENGPANQSTDNNMSIEYKDKLDRIILKKVYNGVRWLETYYVYDEFSLLRFVIPPLAVNTIRINYEGDYSNLTFATVLSGMTTTIGPYVGNSYILEENATLTINPASGSFSFVPTSTSSFVVKPVETTAPASNPVNELCYVYRYDEKHRMIEKKLPGVEIIYMVYDKRDRLVATQDGEMRKSGKWLITRYDALNRPVITAIKTLTTSRMALQSLVDQYVTDDALNTSLDMNALYHIFHYVCVSGIGAPFIESDVLTVNYYDDYYGLDAGYSVYTIDQTSYPSDYRNITTNYSSKTRGLITISKVKNLETTDFFTTVNYYDDKSRIIKSVSDNKANSQNGKDVFMTRYDFSGRVEATLHAHFLNSVLKIKEGQRFTYDQVGRVKDTYHIITQNGNGEVLLSSNTYNEIGQLIQKKLDVKNTSSLQNIDYQYNIRRWLTKINDPTNLNDPVNVTNKDLFAEELYYENLNPGVANRNVTSLGCPVNYNGNISAVTWNDAKKNLFEGYGYSYDNTNRLIKGQFGKNTGGSWALNDYYSLTTVTYDLNGNINTLKRRGGSSGSQIDNLTYSYINNGNRLAKVEDVAGTEGFYNGNTSGNDYAYDDNGNATKDLNKGITSIMYNILNLPKTISKGSQSVTYQFTATGQKLKESFSTGQTTLTTEYINNFVYEQGVLKYILTSEGKVKVSGSTFTYEYWLKDHLGNIRVSFSDANIVNRTIDPSNEVYQAIDYYPFGMNLSNSVADVNQKYGYNGKEKQDMTDWLDYGARMYDSQIGRWHNMDPFCEKINSWTPYNYVRNNPILRLDFSGLWDIKIHVSDNRAQYGYGVAVVSDRFGKEIYRFNVRAEGTAGHNRFITNSDSPLGVYDIPNKNMWEKKSNRISFGPNHVLRLIPKSGEIIKTGRNGILVHGGRQEKKTLGIWVSVENPELKKTHGCFRAFDTDMENLKDITEELMENDPDEYGGTLTAVDDLETWQEEDNIKKEWGTLDTKGDEQEKNDNTYVHPLFDTSGKDLFENQKNW